MMWAKVSSAKVEGKSKNITEKPKEESIYHTELGHLYWTLRDGTKVVCRSYVEYRQAVRGDAKNG